MKRESGVWRYNRATLFLGTWSSTLGDGRKVEDLALQKFIIAKSKEVKSCRILCGGLQLRKDCFANNDDKNILKHIVLDRTLGDEIL
jgi:hypothetical protein